jgi:hypothetical protein
VGISTIDHMRLCFVPLLADRISRWEDAVISRAGFSNQAFSLAGRPNTSFDVSSAGGCEAAYQIMYATLLRRL